jgi:glycosyltransferase involved in cell wall biosynthesis
MNKNPIIIINTEKIFTQDRDFYCNNVDMKVLSEGLSEYHELQFIARKSKKKGNHKVKINNIKQASNIFTYISLVLKSFKIKKASYLIVGITPYSFFSFLILFLFKKKIYTYLRSDGYKEYRHILGYWSIWIYHIMFKTVTSGSTVIVLNSILYNKKNCHLINSSRLDDLWFKENKKAPLDKVKLLYVGRINPEKGIFDFIKIFEQLKLDIQFSIVGDAKNLRIENKNIKLLGYVSDPKNLIDIYDSHNILVLPSFTEGQPYILDECLSRKRPIIIFEDIIHTIRNRKGIFVSKRNAESFSAHVKYIMNNYDEIQKDIEKNKFQTKKEMIKEISDIFI